MKEEIEALNKFFNKKKEYLTQLEELYRNKKISLDDIIGYEKSGLVPNAKALNLFAVKLSKEGDRNSAIKLYQIAMSFGSIRAKKNYESALLQNEEKSLEPVSVLEELFQLVGQEIVPHEIIEDRPQSAKGWHTLSRNFDGFDPIESLEGVKGLTILNFRRAQIQLEIARRELALFTTHLERAKFKAEPKPVPKVLRLGRVEAAERMKKIKAELSTTEDVPHVSLETAKKTEYRRQVQTEKHFFSPHRTHDESTKKIALQLQHNRLTAEQASVVPIIGTNVDGRRMLTAELSNLEALIICYGRKKNYEHLPGWHMNPAKTRAGDRHTDTFQQDYGNTETILLGEGQFRYYQRINPHRNHIGDFLMEKIGSHESRYGHLLFLTGGTDKQPHAENEKKMAKWMIRYTSTGIVVTLEELQKMCVLATQKHLNKLMQIFYYCLIKEPMSWMMPAEASCELPYATAQARAVKLVAKGYIHLKDVFASNALYGIFTGVNIARNMAVVREKIERINETYERCILTRDKEEHPLCFQFKREHPNGELVTSRKHLHEELVDAYGGGEDTDGEGYDSDTAKSLYSTVFKL